MEDCQFEEDGSSKRAPYVIELRDEVETILYESKNYLRDLLGILRVYFGHECTEAKCLYPSKNKRISGLVAWATEKFGQDDPFTKMLEVEQEWIEDLIRQRNAVEHPGGHSGILHIHNFSRAKDGLWIMPTWNRDNNKPRNIYADIEIILGHL